MSFVVNGNEWNFDRWSADEILHVIEAVLERVAIAKERGEIIWLGDDFQTREMLNGKDLWTFLSSEEMLNVSQDVKNELAGWMNSANYYVDEMTDEMVDALEITVDDNAAEFNMDLAWAHHSVLNCRAVACLSFCPRGARNTESSRGHARVHWVSDETTNVEFWRNAIDVERDSRETIERLGPHAFPKLFFIPGVWSGLDDLSDGYTPLREIIRYYLAGLNDYGSWIFSASNPVLRQEDDRRNEIGNPPDQLVIERFNAIRLNVSPEKISVAKHDASRIAREVKVGGRTLYCEWHGKFEPHQNRIYFHRPVKESGGQLVIGVINRHL